MEFPNIDKNQARRQLELLGYQEKDSVYLRFFYPSDDPRKDSDKGRKSDRINWQQIQTYQKEGRGVYFVVNGGGHKNAQVKSGRAVFIEHDDLPKEIQRDLWKKLGLPEPTFQLDTGGKSIHSFWVFEQFIAINIWCELQRDLLEFTDADRSIKNPARVMRLAGAWHISINEGKSVYNQSQIISESGQKYSYEELRNIVPYTNSVPREDFPLLNSELPQTNNRQIPKHPDQIILPVPAAVPLENCLARANRELINSGVLKGKRTSSGIKLAFDLIGTYQYLLSIGQSVDGYPRQLLSEYASRCTPPLSSAEVASIWNSAYSDNPTPSCTGDGVETCVRSWYWREHIKNSTVGVRQEEFSPNTKNENTKSSNKNTQSQNQNTQSQNQNTQQPKQQERETLSTMRHLLADILAKHPSAPELTEIFNDLAEHSGWSVKEIRLLATEIDDNFELEHSRSERKAELEQLQEYKQRRLDLNQILPPSYGQPMSLMAQWMEAPSAALLTGFMPIFASCLHPETRVIIKECIGFIEPPIIYSGIVTESGQRKSPLINALADPLKQLQAEEELRYASEKQEYDREHQLWREQKDTMSPQEWKDSEPLPPKSTERILHRQSHHRSNRQNQKPTTKYRLNLAQR